jgi:hypothetical protein
MRIRAEQILAFEDAGGVAFEDYMVGHLKEFAPLYAEALGTFTTLRLVQGGVGRARKYGFTRRGPVTFYIETIILLGFSFDTDPQYPRLTAILRDKSTPDEIERADRAHAWLMDLLGAAGGPERKYSTAALRRALKLPLYRNDVDSPAFCQGLVRELRAFYPEKAAYLGDTIIHAVIDRAVEEAQKYSLSTGAGISLFAGWMLAAGHGFIDDPRYAWIAGDLSKSASEDADQRVEQLHARTRSYLNHILDRLENS